MSPRAYIPPFSSTATQMARPPATRDVADPFGGRSAFLIRGTNLSFDAYFAARAESPRENCIIITNGKRVGNEMTLLL